MTIQQEQQIKKDFDEKAIAGQFAMDCYIEDEYDNSIYYDEDKISDYFIACIKNQEKEIIEKIKQHIFDEHIHFDKSDPYQFEDERPYVDSLKLETFINNL